MRDFFQELSPPINFSVNTAETSTTIQTIERVLTIADFIDDGIQSIVELEVLNEEEIINGH